MSRLCLDAVLWLGTSVLVCLGVLVGCVFIAVETGVEGRGKKANFWVFSIGTLVMYIHLL